MNCTSVYITYINGTHTHTRTLHFIYIFMYRYTVLLYTSWQMDFNCVYTTVHCCTTWHYLNTHLWCTHYAQISYMAVRLYFSPFSVHSGTVLLCIQLHCITVQSLVPTWPLLCQPITEELWFTCFALIGPLVIPWSWSRSQTWSLIACWPRPFPSGKGRGKNTFP